MKRFESSGGRRSGPRRALLLAALLLLAAPSQAGTDFSLRMASYNTYLKPATGMCYWSSQPCLEVCRLAPPALACAKLGGPAAEFLCECGWNEAYYEEPWMISVGAQSIAQGIIASGYDLVALQEVFDDDARVVLRDQLLPDYPQMVTELDEANNILGSSGLMLVAKSQFLLQQFETTCGTCQSGDCEATVYAQGVEATAPEQLVEFIEFTESTQSDSYAAKGVGFVRLYDTDSNWFHNVFFTHTQGSYPESAYDPGLPMGAYDTVVVRDAQLAQTKAFIDCLEADGVLDPTTEFVHLLGDLNIDGDRTNSRDDINDDAMNNLGEWSYAFGPSASAHGGFFAGSTLTDQWAAATLQEDFRLALIPDAEVGNTTRGGQSLCFSDPNTTDSSSDPNCRFDYILSNGHSPVLPEQLCNQRMSLAVNLYDSHRQPGGIGPGGRGNHADGEAGDGYATAFASDHHGVNANFNLPFAQCSPLDPSTALSLYGEAEFGVATLSPGEIGIDGNGCPNFANAGTIKDGIVFMPGNVQWWKINQSGGYLIGFVNDKDNTVADTSYEKGFKLEVYHHADFTWPKKANRDEEWTVDGMLDNLGAPTTSITGYKYELIDPPYYVKVYHPDHAITGPYQFGAHRLNCKNKGEEACLLSPNMRLADQCFPPAIVPSSPVSNSLYYQVDVQRPTAGTAQDLNFIIDGFAQTGHVELSVVESSADTLLAAADMTCDSIPGPDYSPCYLNVPQPGFPAPSGDSERMFIRARRANMSTAPDRFGVTWTTTLTAFFGSMFGQDGGSNEQVHLRCEEENDASANDEIHIRFNVDGMWQGLGVDASTNGYWVDHMDEDGDGMRELQIDGLIQGVGNGFLNTAPLPYLYTDYLRIDLVEDESGHSDSDFCSTNSGHPEYHDECDYEFVTATEYRHPEWRLGPGSAQTRYQNTFRWDPNDADEGFYKIWYNLNHGTQAFMPPPVPVELQLPGMTATQASNGGGVAGYAIDGNLGSSSETGNEVEPWWQLDLGAPRSIQRVEPFSDGTLQDFWVEVSIDGLNWSSYHYFEPSIPIPLNQSRNVEVAQWARFVRIKLPGPGTSTLRLPEVKVWGR